jgi:hypothetical protein
MTAKSNVLVGIISTLLHLLAPGILQDRRPSKLNLDSPTEIELQSTTEEYKTFTSGESIIEYARNFYGLRKNTGDASTQLFAEFVNNSSKEDGGDMSMASLPNSISESTMAIYNTPQPKYDPVRGSVLINELINATASFISGFIQTCALSPSMAERGGRAVNENKAHYHSLFHNVCGILGHLMARANIKPIDIQDCMEALFKCSSDGPDFTFVSSSLNTLLQIADSPSYIKASPWHPKLVKAIVDNVSGKCGNKHKSNTLVTSFGTSFFR